MRDGDHVVTFSTKESSLLEQSGVDTRKIFIVDPPTARDYGRFYREHFSTGLGAANRQILVILDAQNIGFDKNYGLISARRKNESYIDLLEFLAMRFKTSRILIKPHPIIDFLPEVMEMFQRISDRIEFLPKDDAVENYFEQAFLILQPPRAVSTSLNTAAMMYPSKRIVSLYIFEEFLGDYYRDHPTVEYYTRLQDFYESCDKPTVGREAMYLHDGAHSSRSDFQRKFRNLVEMISEIC